MDVDDMQAVIEAQFLMGHCVASASTDFDRVTILDYSWDVDQVRQALRVPWNALWDERILELEVQKLISFCLYAAPVTHDDDGTEHAIPGWQDEPREKWGSLSVHPRGVLRLAALYHRPYVRFHESPALLAHWQLVQAECTARLHTPYDAAQWAREYPEAAERWKHRQAQLDAERDDQDQTL